MKINGTEINHNKRMTASQIGIVGKRYESLKKQIHDLDTDELEFFISQSHQSESIYIAIQNLTNGESEEISVRNHDEFASWSDHVVYMNQFATWTALKNYIIDEMIPMVARRVSGRN